MESVFEFDYVRCKYCNKLYPKEQMGEIGNKFLCDDCLTGILNDE